ncbi:enoyl-CoA hydratase/isomerase family protein [Sporomusa sp. KB1]|jgi:enoyl-CoA hydratase/carnithine racemase|uniref:enoyl-CoA hydratase/isomerase family protein n=1 Tax=Sporomusa sp. KB1 TaxID=943346 RepID=UPI00119F071A|nr:enoyl-CoA hydratase-related protein [Sporomusa sp. KB1]TWH46742.1 enoyl-CoA hydratase [Sporomusa sp. KB1]
MSFNNIILENKDGIGFITLNDPENRNTVSGPIVGELGQCLDECNDDPNVRAIVIRGAGSVFSAGGNIKAMKERLEKGIDYRANMRNLGTIIVKIRNIRKPVIASIHGAAAGAGLSLALVCDFRIMVEDTKCVFAFVNLGLIPDCGAPLPLVKMVGAARATELLMTGRMFTGKEAYDWGLVNQIVPHDQLEAATMKFAKKLAQGPTVAYGMIKAMINRNAFGGLELELDNEVEFQSLCARTEDHIGAVDAFIEKRKPVFQGR